MRLYDFNILLIQLNFGIIFKLLSLIALKLTNCIGFVANLLLYVALIPASYFWIFDERIVVTIIIILTYITLHITTLLRILFIKLYLFNTIRRFLKIQVQFSNTTISILFTLTFFDASFILFNLFHVANLFAI